MHCIPHYGPASNAKIEEMSRLHYSLSYKNEHCFAQMGGAIIARNEGNESIVGIYNTKEVGFLITAPVYSWLQETLDDIGYTSYEKNLLGKWELLPFAEWESSSDSLEDKVEPLISAHVVDQKQIDEIQQPEIVLTMPSEVNNNRSHLKKKFYLKFIFSSPKSRGVQFLLIFMQF